MEKEQVAKLFEDIGNIGKGEKGITRLAYSEVEVKAREYIKEQMKKLGLKVRMDEAGNIIGRLETEGTTGLVVATGSHVDTVPEGGNYDGVVGVIGGLAAVQRLKNKGSLAHPIEVICFASEESSRFGIATIGSKAMAGMIDPAEEKWRLRKDQDGVSLSQAMKQAGCSLEKISEAARNEEEFKAFVELHIEQGPVLEREGIDVGIVEAIAAPTRMMIDIEGVADHSGATPMNYRSDAAVAAGKIIVAVQRFAKTEAQHGTVGTVGVVNISPNALNVVPGHARVGVDIRGIKYESIERVLAQLSAELKVIAEEEKVAVSVEKLGNEKPVSMDANIMRSSEDAAQKLGLSFKRMPSGAGHDAMNIATLAGVGMVFIPCRNGISHNPAEYVGIDSIMKGIDVLTETLYELAK